VNTERLDLIAPDDALISEATSKRLAAILAVGGLPATASTIRGLSIIADRIAAMDYDHKPSRRGRAPDVAGDAVIEQLYYFWWSIKGTAPGVSRPPGGGQVGGPFVRFARKVATEILADLVLVPPLGRTRPADSHRNSLRTSLSQIAQRPEKVRERLKSVRQLWLLPSLKGGIVLRSVNKKTKK